VNFIPLFDRSRPFLRPDLADRQSAARRCCPGCRPAPAKPARSVLDSIEHGATLAIKGLPRTLTAGRRSYGLRLLQRVTLLRLPSTDLFHKRVEVRCDFVKSNMAAQIAIKNPSGKFLEYIQAKKITTRVARYRQKVMRSA
jgi:hypothetical protein